MREDGLIARLRALLATSDPSVTAGSGPDDCAHVLADGRALAMSADAFVEGSHFLADARPEDVAYKALAASLSDLAASGCRARWALVSLCLKKGLPGDWSERFAAELARTAAAFGVAVVGGDTISSADAVFLSVTVIGEPLPGGPLLRSGARPGDALIVTGELGGSLLGRHLRPVPRLDAVRVLMEFCRGRGSMPTAAMDISDGLALDLSRLCRESGVGAAVEADAVPVSPAAERMAGTDGKTPLDHAFSDGEDFELLLTLPPGVWRDFSAWIGENGDRAGLPRFTRIGEIRSGGGLVLRDSAGGERPLAFKGYEHQW